MVSSHTRASVAVVQLDSSTICKYVHFWASWISDSSEKRVINANKSQNEKSQRYTREGRTIREVDLL